MGIVAQVLEVTTAKAARDLASVILNPQRRIPMVVVSLPAADAASGMRGGGTAGRSGVVDVDDLTATVGVRADVATITPDVVDDLNALLPIGVRVYGDAVRVYPPATTWTPRAPHCELISTVADLEQGLRRVRAMVDALNPPPRRPRPTPPPPATVPASAARQDLGAPPPDRVRHADTPAAVDDLIALLLHPGRRHPVVVVTTAADGATCWIDAQAVAREVATLAWVTVVPTGRLTFRLNDTIGRDVGVYGGAGRVYPPAADLHRSRLRTAYDPAHGARVTDALIGDALALAMRDERPGEQVARVPATGRVVATAPPTRAVVRLDDGAPATIWADSIPAGVDIDHLVTPGQDVQGLLDPTTGRLDVRDELLDHHAWVAALNVDDVVLARVEAVEAMGVILSPAPGTLVRVGVGEVTGNPLDDVRDLVTVGEVLPARITCTGAGLDMTLLDLDPDTVPTVTPPRLLPGGPCWLTPETPDAPDDDTDTSGRTSDDSPPPTNDAVPTVPTDSLGPEGRPQPTPVRPSPPAQHPTPTPQAAPQPSHGGARGALGVGADGRGGDVLGVEALEDLRAQVEALTGTVRDQQQQIARHVREIERLRAVNRRARTARKSTGREAEAVIEYGFPDPLEQLRWDVQRTWVAETLPDDKARFPLPEVWHVGGGFIDSLAVPGVTRAKVMSVVVAVLTGRHPRGTHVLRTALSGGAPQVVREDGATAWRTPLQQSTPSARRLHWWRRSDGSVELSRVVVHDDFTP